MIPFVGRSRELGRMRLWLQAGRNVVLTGAFGSGRTALVQQLAVQLAGSHRFVFRDATATRRQLQGLLASSSHRRDVATVLVIDGLPRLTSQRRVLLGRLSHGERLQIVVIADSCLQPHDFTRLRAALGAAPLLRLGPVASTAAERYFAECAKANGLGWGAGEIRGMARSTHGYPLGMRMALDAAAGRPSTAINRPI